MDVLIVGAGSMGTWFGRAIDATVTFADVDPAAATAAAEAVGDGAETTGLEDDGEYDVVCLAVPMTHVVDAVGDHAHRARRAIVDVSGVMDAPLEAMATHAPDLERASLHPLFAPERAPGSIAVVRDDAGPTIESLLADLTERGNDPIETTTTEHDEAMETVQAATHAAVLSFALATEPVPDGFETPIYEGLETLVEQMTEGTPRVYADIQGVFDGADRVADAAAAIADADADELEALYRDAAAQWQPDDAAGVDGDADREPTNAAAARKTKTKTESESETKTNMDPNGGPTE
ncbi:prephenate dehydrogenase/arogenate dehydrogenase family protein [Natronolimnohabitans innermongolicus]|uniref:Prephenate dehydrogenase n=1 Tax=Natronolimnohabitans innermongolicus JCM 12255 TaxID=1227499 RepID=L9XLW1_9EURY|nr:prephenate dehydrogenase/arogenate dehydrogenase family protein [Natronolimnohabitans innermongolicus]ELY61648.1 prephenate dehydrogenase [Natronolimnohabitans innermongolicus JCM 12255]